MDEARLDTLGAAPIGPELSAIRAAKDRQDITELMARNNTDFYATIFSLGTDVDLKDTSHYAVYATQGGLGLPDRDYYLKPSFASQKAAYQTYVAKLLTLIGWPEPEANAAAVVAFETQLADAT
jgi:putative endopeptidase